jgi:hypothetical protein
LSKKDGGVRLAGTTEEEGERQVRRIFMFVGLSMLLLVVAAGIVVAATKVCKDKPCRGSENDDELYERVGDRKDDRILGLDGEDVIEAGTFNRDRDLLEGGRKDDRLLTDDGDGKDTARGGRGSDRCVADEGDRVESCRRISPTSVEGMALSREASNASASADDSGETSSP